VFTCSQFERTNHRVHAELQSSHSIVYGKKQPSLVRVRGARKSAFTISTVTFKVVVYSTCTLQLRGQVYSPYFLFYPYTVYTLWQTDKNRGSLLFILLFVKKLNFRPYNNLAGTRTWTLVCKFWMLRRLWVVC
jgi:hypothetical protein